MSADNRSNYKAQMGKNIIIFSDGTGQAGGLQPDQRLSNVYKLFRAARVGPDNAIDPAQQVAFYDAGLGTSKDEGTLPLRTVRFFRKFLSAAIGFGISRNIADCYEAILKHYEPGDRIFLFGFSRGAYTVRCVAGVLNLCGIPTRTPSAEACPRYGSALRRIADEAVADVYEHGAGRDRERFEPERLEKARRFRARYGSEFGGESNAPPYFVGVFDTVAALGASGSKKFVMNVGILAMAVAFSASLAKVIAFTGADFLQAFLVLLALGALVGGSQLLRSSLKLIRDFPTRGETRWHLSGWRSGFYDCFLSKRVRYARHALAIDETRSAFGRVPWGVKGDLPDREPGEPQWLVQLWFAGNHSDIGGSYPEDESRLSDTALQWLVEQATSLPHPLIVDESKLHLFPSAVGLQHSEVEAVLDMFPRWVPVRWRFGWKEAPRPIEAAAPLHPSVLTRFAAASVPQCGTRRVYRPQSLAGHKAVSQYFEIK
jgi:uncharacterized protein (DUF2235 family)